MLVHKLNTILNWTMIYQAVAFIFVSIIPNSRPYEFSRLDGSLPLINFMAEFRIARAEKLLHSSHDSPLFMMPESKD